jgi:TRAP-type C4-dicarboxylate transport system permease small subunit
MRALVAICGFFDLIARILTPLTVAVMALVVLIQVFMRYMLSSPLVWGDELAHYALAFMTFIGAAVALRRGQLAAMDLLIDKVPASVGRALTVGVIALNTALLIFLLYCSINLIGQKSVLTQVSPAMRIPMKYIYSCMPIGLTLMVFQSIYKLLEYFTGNKTN